MRLECREPHHSGRTQQLKSPARTVPPAVQVGPRTWATPDRRTAGTWRSCGTGGQAALKSRWSPKAGLGMAIFDQRRPAGTASADGTESLVRARIPVSAPHRLHRPHPSVESRVPREPVVLVGQHDLERVDRTAVPVQPVGHRYCLGSSGTSTAIRALSRPSWRRNVTGDAQGCAETSPLRVIDGAAGWPKIES